MSFDELHKFLCARLDKVEEEIMTLRKWLIAIVFLILYLAGKGVLTPFKLVSTLLK